MSVIIVCISKHLFLNLHKDNIYLKDCDEYYVDDI